MIYSILGTALASSTVAIMRVNGGLDWDMVRIDIPVNYSHIKNTKLGHGRASANGEMMYQMDSEVFLTNSEETSMEGKKLFGFSTNRKQLP